MAKRHEPIDGKAQERRKVRTMKKTTPRSAWEDIPGFDRTTGEYIRLDGDAWLDAHRIRSEGEKRGKRNQPGSDETLPDAMYNRIIAWVRKRAVDCKQGVGDYINNELAHLRTIKTSWEEQNPVIGLDALVEKHCQELRTQTDQSVSDLNNMREEYEDAVLDLRKFRQEHRLLRVAHYPSNKYAHWLWVLFAGIIESFVSANLLGSVSRGGVIEGWMVAVVLTAVNVLLGVGAGWGWRFTHYNWGFRKLFFGVLPLVFCVALALVWNDVAGHVRDVYILAEKTGVLEAPDEAFATAYHMMIERPIPWESVQSAGLAFVGIFVFALTTYEMCTADDPFPGYGAKHRKVEILLDRYQDNLNDALEKLEAAHNDAYAAVDEIKERYQIDRAGWGDVLDRLRMVVDGYPANLRLYNADLAYLLAAYRSANLDTRTTPSPPFFEIEPTIDEDVLRPPEFEIPEAPKWGDVPTKVETGFKQVRETYAQLLPRYQMLNHVVDDYADETS